MKTPDLCARLALLRELKEFHEAQAEVLGSEISKLSPEAYRQMLDDGMESMRVVGSMFKDTASRIVTPSLKYKPSVQDQPKLFTYLRANQSSDMIKETVHPKTLESWVKSLKENNLPLPPEDVLKIFTIETVTVRRAPKSA